MNRITHSAREDGPGSHAKSKASTALYFMWPERLAAAAVERQRLA